MLRGGRLRRRRRSSNDEEGRQTISKEVLEKAKKIVRQEISDFKSNIKTLLKENARHRETYQVQEEALKKELTKVSNQLEQRRDTLLATTSLIPYTQTIQAASTLRVPAALLTLQARLCLHVHCLCVHEELLLLTKERQWDCIAHLEDVSKCLRYLTQRQVSTLQKQLVQRVEEMQNISNCNCNSSEEEVGLPKDIMETYQQVKAQLETENQNETSLGTSATATTTSTTDMLIQEKTPSSAELVHQLPYEQQSPTSQQQLLLQKEDDDHKSFTEFLQRYQQRKEAQQKAEQARGLGRGGTLGFGGSNHSIGTGNPYRNQLSKAQVGKKLKNYASKFMTLPQQGQSRSNGAADTAMDESFHLEDFTAGSKHSRVQPKKWIQKGKHFLSEHYSDSNLDHSLSSLGSSLRGLRFRASANGGTGGDKQAPRSVVEEGEENGDDNDDDDEVGSFQGDDDADDGYSDTKIHGKEDQKDEVDGDNASSIGHDDLSASEHTQSKGRLSGLKSKLKNRPVVQKFFESATW